MSISDLVLEMVKSVVDHPERASINQTDSAGGDTVLEIVVDDSDVGQVIGRKGRILGAIERIVEAATVRETNKGNGKRVYVTICDPRDRVEAV